MRKTPTSQIVVARCGESIDLKALEEIAPLIVYDKSGRPAANSLPNIPRFPRKAFGGAHHAKTPTGREAHTYLFHILRHYPHFPDFTLFLQAKIGDHSLGLPMIGDLMRSRLGRSDYQPLGWPLALCRWDGAPGHFGLPIQRIFKRLFLPPCPQYFLYSSAALFAVSKRSILARPRSFYEEMMQIIYDEPLAGYVFERLWGAVFLLKSARHRSRYPKRDARAWLLPELALHLRGDS